jgi:hypothetical protein
MGKYIQANGAGVVDDLTFKFRELQTRLVIERLKGSWKGMGGHREKPEDQLLSVVKCESILRVLILIYDEYL